VSGADPNSGHLALVELEQHVPQFTLVTQNVDDLHNRAGSQRVIELHGNLTRTKCFEEGDIVTEWEATTKGPPRCPRCGGLLRPDVVWFGEGLPRQALTAAIEATHTCDLFFSVGTSAVVQPAASLPLEARQHGATVVEINPQQTPVTPYMDFVLSGPAGQVLPALVQATWTA
jgi:NAD-dependent deacetylase